jgi:hypothetical protein
MKPSLRMLLQCLFSLLLAAEQGDAFIAANHRICTGTDTSMLLSAISSLKNVGDLPLKAAKPVTSLKTIQDIPSEGIGRVCYYHITWTNFWKKTRAHFTACEAPTRKPDFVSSRSAYWDQGDHVVRRSDHWSEQFGIYSIRGCVWTIDQDQTKGAKFIAGKCDYADFERGKRSSMKRRMNLRKKEDENKSV